RFWGKMRMSSLRFDPTIWSVPRRREMETSAKLTTEPSCQETERDRRVSSAWKNGLDMIFPPLNVRGQDCSRMDCCKKEGEADLVVAPSPCPLPRVRGRGEESDARVRGRGEESEARMGGR